MATYHIPASSEEAARAVVYGIEAGRIPALPEYLDAIKAHEAFDSYQLGFKRGLTLWTIERGSEAQTIMDSVWRADRVGDLAAALMIVVGGAFAVGLGSMLS